MKRVLALALIVFFIIGCASVPSTVETVAMKSSARIAGCYAAKQITAPGELDIVLGLTKAVAGSAGAWEISDLITKIRLLEDDDLNKMVALSLRDVLEVYGIGLDALTSNQLMPASVKIMAESFLEGVEVCSGDG
jgi:hypothetical protein